MRFTAKIGGIAKAIPAGGKALVTTVRQLHPVTNFQRQWLVHLQPALGCGHDPAFQPG